MFEELNAPEYMNGDANKPHDCGWYVRIKGESMFHSLHTDGELKWFHNSQETAFYPTEEDAHAAANYYYFLHLKEYPYTVQWAMLGAMKDGGKMLGMVESQTMRFK